jgi:hypothetical protein
MDRHNTIQLFVEAQMGRREFLGNLFKLSALGLVPLAGKVAHSLPVFEEEKHPAYSNPERAALIEEWVKRVNQTIVTLESFWTSLIHAQTTPPAQVNGKELFDQYRAMRDAMDSLSSQLDTTNFETCFDVATGQKMWAIGMEKDINEGWYDDDPDFWRRELASQRPEDRPEANHLLALLDSRVGV